MKLFFLLDKNRFWRAVSGISSYYWRSGAKRKGLLGLITLWVSRVNEGPRAEDVQTVRRHKWFSTPDTFSGWRFIVYDARSYSTRCTRDMLILYETLKTFGFCYTPQCICICIVERIKSKRVRSLLECGVFSFCRSTITRCSLDIYLKLCVWGFAEKLV